MKFALPLLLIAASALAQTDTTYTEAGCTSQGFTWAECRSSGYTRWDYGLRFAASRELTLSAQVTNVFGKRVPVAWAGWVNGGGIFPPSTDDPRVEIELLEAGADDYLVKPVVPARVEARVRAVLRRSGTELTV